MSWRTILAEVEVSRKTIAEMLRQRANAEVAAFLPRGIDQCGTAWQMTAPADAEFSRALQDWEESGTKEDRARVGHAYHQFVDAWRYAASRFESRRSSTNPGPITVIEGDAAEPGFRVPVEDTVVPVELDATRVAAIAEETKAAAQILTAVFDPDDRELADDRQLSDERRLPDEPWPADAGPDADGRDDAGRGGHLGLDEQHLALLAVLADRREWSPAELDHAARDLGLLRNGAVEAINDAAFEACGEPLLEGSDPIQVNDYALEAMEVE